MQQNNQHITADIIKKRIKTLRCVILLALAIIVIRLFVVQIIEHDYWVARANDEHMMLETITASRGEIYMMNQGEPVPVVLNQTTYQVIIDPAITDKAQIKAVLETYAQDYITADLDEVYNVAGSRYAVVAKNVPLGSADKIAESDIPAVYLKSSNRRVYPEGSLASGLLGFVNADGLGQYGVEGSLNTLLSGKDGMFKSITDVNKVALSIGDENVKVPAEDGKDLVLTIDRGLEQGIEEILASSLQETAATNAAALVMNPNNGKVLAMANVPTYDPSNYGNVQDASAYLNYVTEVPYEPASVCKNFAFSAAINEGVMSADTTYFNQGYEIIDEQKIENAEKRSSLYGGLTMRDALYWSLNTGSIYALKLLGGDTNNINAIGRERLYDYYYNKFRLGQPTNIELIESEGFIWDPHAEIYGLNAAYANMTFGQNLSLTMIQTATAFSAVINNGYYRTPTIIEGILNNNQITPLPKDNVIDDKILSDDTSAAMREMLINNRGYKVNQGIDRQGYDIGGKSGTAQVITNGAYDDTMSELVGTYIGYVATEGELPKYVIMVKIWGEGRQLDGSGVAGSLFDATSNYLIDYLKIKPKA